ncbi:hypothetical protein OIDMADRAFT_201765 [Oidiodendron maius Zn]|uniref:Nephrocystin 3-like N-terminal domain-containing protein n=1 Tax=Oidiodendron maius (strain Zn) TaxID=913774 RepID=A0A0C3GT20_OIDMZ|nr:hypothetical protein OIDMADRAFT_201765 [Oidiodendron maius Zn]
MDPISVTGTIIAVLQITSSLISICYDYRTGVKGATREAVQITEELTSLRNILESLLQVVEKSQSSEGKDGSRLATFELLAKDGGLLMNCKTELERLKSKLEPETGWRKMRNSLIWPLKEGEVRKALDGLERLKGTMVLALSTDQADGVQDLTGMVLRLADDQQHQKIYEWLAAPDSFANHIANRKKCQPNSGTWLLTSKSYESWLNEQKSFIWLYGIPGSGKSVLCSTVIEQLLQHCKQIPQSAIAYFYFDFSNTGKRDAVSLLQSVITQLLAACVEIPQTLLDLYQVGKGIKPAEYQDLITTLHNMIPMFYRAYLVFDALDESTNCDEVTQLIQTIQSWEISNLHLIVTSRQLPEIEEALSLLVTHKICVHDSKLNKDIALYVADKLQNDKILAKWPPEIRSQIQKKLLTEDGGILDETYDRLLLGIDEIHQSEAMKVLQALTVSRDPLTLEEIVEILAVNLEATPPRFESDSRLLDPRDILSMCSSLVTTSFAEQWDEGIISPLRLAHASVADYLMSPGSSGLSQFHFTRNAARQFLAQTCLVYLLKPEFSKGDDGFHRDGFKNFPFLSHAASFWPFYLQKEQSDSEDHLTPRTKEILHMFFSTSKLPKGGNFATWVRMLIRTSPATYVQNTHPLYYAASFGLLEVVRIILDTESGVDINARGGRAYATALHVSVYREHIDVARLLLQRGADPNIPNNIGESPMYWAVRKRNRAMKNLLVEYGAPGKVMEEADWRTAVSSRLQVSGVEKVNRNFGPQAFRRL